MDEKSKDNEVNMKKIGIIVAMNRESGLLELFKEHKKERLCGMDFFSFKANDNEIVLTTCGIGEVNSSSATTLLIVHFGVEEIINYGYVGSLKHDLPLSVVVGVNAVVHTDVDLTAFGNVLGQYDERAERDFSPSVELTKKILGENCHMGRLASADKFLADGNTKLAIAEKFSADICDMEGAGIAVCSERAGIPFALIKVVADGIEEDCGKTFSENSLFGVDDAIRKIAEYISK